MSKSSAATLTVCALSASFLSASEVIRKDLVLGVEALPSAFSYEIGQSPARTGSDHFDHALGLRLGPHLSAGGPGESLAWVGGVELRAADYRYASYGSFRTYGIGFTAGLAWAINDVLILGLEPLVEIGLSEARFEDNPGFPELRAQGQHIAYGARLGLSWALARRWILGIEGGWMGIQSNMRDEQDHDFSITQGGAVFALTIGWRWDCTPKTLE